MAYVLTKKLQLLLYRHIQGRLDTRIIEEDGKDALIFGQTLHHNDQFIRGQNDNGPVIVRKDRVTDIEEWIK